MMITYLLVACEVALPIGVSVARFSEWGAGFEVGGTAYVYAEDEEDWTYDLVLSEESDPCSALDKDEWPSGPYVHVNVRSGPTTTSVVGEHAVTSGFVRRHDDPGCAGISVQAQTSSGFTDINHVEDDTSFGEFNWFMDSEEVFGWWNADACGAIPAAEECP